jgi:hypothetical protein
MLIRYPRTSPVIMILAVTAALAVAALIVHLVLTFGWYASGLAADKEEERQRQTAPIDVQFSDPIAS